MASAAAHRSRSSDCRWTVFGRLAVNLALLAAFRSQPGVAVIDLTDNIAQRCSAVLSGTRRS